MNATFILIALAFSLHILGYVICSWRWQLLLKAQGAEVALTPLASSYLVGMFFNSFLPGIVSGDVVRGMDVSRHVGGLSTSFLVVFVERLTGIVALLLLSAFALPLIGWDVVGQTKIHLVLLIVGCLIVFTIVILSNQRLRVMITKQPVRFPVAGKIISILDKIYRASEIFGNKKRVVLGCTLISIAFQIIVIIHYWLIGKALGLILPWYCYFAIIPVSIFVMMVPASINGIGVREQVFIYLFGSFGLTPTEAVSVAWIGFAMVLIQALVGGIVFVFRKNRTG
jgi:uncharacterized protein (TIRG00374 family)